MILCKLQYAEQIDEAVFPGVQGSPLMQVIAGKAVCLAEAMQPAFRQYARQVVDNARALADALLSGGLSLVSGGTDNHLILVDVSPLGISGQQAETILDRCGITANKNVIPYDRRPRTDPSGIRFGTPAITSRGMGGDEMQRIGRWIAALLRSPNDQSLAQRVAGEVAELCRTFPVPNDC
jgi:glycine hydroxymethyltransferase